jgi:hypothetical protein
MYPQYSTTGTAGVIPGSIAEVPGAKVTDAPNQFLPVNNSSTLAAAALNVLCPEMNSGNGGVGNEAGWYGNQSAPSMRTVPFPGPPHDRICCP